MQLGLAWDHFRTLSTDHSAWNNTATGGYSGVRFSNTRGHQVLGATLYPTTGTSRRCTCRWRTDHYRPAGFRGGWSILQQTPPHPWSGDKRPGRGGIWCCSAPRRRTTSRCCISPAAARNGAPCSSEWTQPRTHGLAQAGHPSLAGRSDLRAPVDATTTRPLPKPTGGPATFGESRLRDISCRPRVCSAAT